MPQDWFAQNAPSAAKGGWFAQNAPGATATPSQPPQPANPLTYPLEVTADAAKGVLRSAGRVGMQALQYGQYLTGSKVSPTPTMLEPSDNPAQGVGETIGNAALALAPAVLSGGASLPVQAAVGATVGGMEGGVPGAVVGGAAPAVVQGLRELFSNIPTAAKAGQKFEQVAAAANKAPIDTTAAEDAVARAQELRQRGSTLPKVLNDFIKNRAADPNPMTYEVGRDFASNAGALSTREITAMNAKMQRQVAEFAASMKDANRGAAVNVGMGDLYDAAMKEYRQAKTLQEAGAVLTKWGKRAVIAAGMGTAGKIGFDLWKAH